MRQPHSGRSLDGLRTWARPFGRPASAALLAAFALLAAGCGPTEEPSDAGASPAASGEERTLTVFAAASLTETFEQLGQEFEDANPGVTVQFNFAGSSELATQITEGAPADVFAALDRTEASRAAVVPG